MTKKFWNEWQTRIGETKTIVLQNGKIYFGKEEYANTLVSAKFTKNTVEIKTVEFWQNKTIEIDGFTLHY